MSQCFANNWVVIDRDASSQIQRMGNLLANSLSQEESESKLHIVTMEVESYLLEDLQDLSALQQEL